MLSKADIKYIKSLQVKKYRKQEQSFIVEGAKSVLELLASDFEVLQVVATARFVSENPQVPIKNIIEVSESVLNDLGEFETNNSVLAVARIKPNNPINLAPKEFALVLDDIRDPGNLGTIIRTADWYGINKIIASSETADMYNPKVIASTMGSFVRVQLFYTVLAEYLQNVRQKIYGTYLDGKNVHDMQFSEGGFIVIGNESRGIGSDLEKFITDKITIPKYGKAESLNAAIATAVICDNIRR